MAGLLFWFIYVAVQPHDYARALGSPDRLDTLFGWRAPGIDPKDFIERDRIWVAMAGWLVIGLIAGRLRPRLWPFVGPVAVLPTLVVFFATAPHDAQGWWVANAIFLPVVAGAVSVGARVAAALDWLFQNTLVYSFGVGVLFAVAMLTGGGESNAAVFGVGVASAVTVGAATFAKRALTSDP